MGLSVKTHCPAICYVIHCHVPASATELSLSPSRNHRNSSVANRHHKHSIPPHYPLKPPRSSRYRQFLSSINTHSQKPRHPPIHRWLKTKPPICRPRQRQAALCLPRSLQTRYHLQRPAQHQRLPYPISHILAELPCVPGPSRRIKSATMYPTKCYTSVADTSSTLPFPIPTTKSRATSPWLNYVKTWTTLSISSGYPVLVSVTRFRVLTRRYWY